MRTMVREALKDEPPLAFSHRTVKNPSDEVILDALRPLWIIREDDETGVCLVPLGGRSGPGPPHFGRTRGPRDPEIRVGSLRLTTSTTGP